MAGGRPTSWSLELEEKAWEYVNGGWRDVEHAVPMVVGLCSFIDRSSTAVYEWEKDEDKEFKDIVKAIKEAQHLELFNKSLTGEYNASMSKLMLTKHGYSDKIDNDVTTGGKPIKNEWHIHPVTADKDGSS